jgi:hypothetical protein
MTYIRGHTSGPNTVENREVHGEFGFSANLTGQLYRRKGDLRSPHGRMMKAQGRRMTPTAGL